MEQQIPSMILTHNLTELSKYLQSVNQFEKKYIVKNESSITTLMKETNWLKGMNLVKFAATQWKQQN